uniref:Copine C-terminal domain-containing protein n=1 Tax=Zea mays TaxID=4577 RepID=A0A804MD31_MAIZE
MSGLISSAEVDRFAGGAGSPPSSSSSVQSPVGLTPGMDSLPPRSQSSSTSSAAAATGVGLGCGGGRCRVSTRTGLDSAEVDWGMSGDEDVRVEVAKLIVFLHRGGIWGGEGCEAAATGWTGICSKSWRTPSPRVHSTAMLAQAPRKARPQSLRWRGQPRSLRPQSHHRLIRILPRPSIAQISTAKAAVFTFGRGWRARFPSTVHPTDKMSSVAATPSPILLGALLGILQFLLLFPAEKNASPPSTASEGPKEMAKLIKKSVPGWFFVLTLDLGQLVDNIFQANSLSNTPNTYEQDISIIGRTLSKFDEDNLIPCFGFGDASTHDQDVFVSLLTRNLAMDLKKLLDNDQHPLHRCEAKWWTIPRPVDNCRWEVAGRHGSLALLPQQRPPAPFLARREMDRRIHGSLDALEPYMRKRTPSICIYTLDDLIKEAHNNGLESSLFSGNRCNQKVVAYLREPYNYWGLVGFGLL